MNYVFKEYLDFARAVTFKNSHILSVARNVPEVGLRHIASHCANTLEVLFIGISREQHFTEACVNAVRHQCTNMHTFHIVYSVGYT